MSAAEAQQQEAAGERLAVPAFFPTVPVKACQPAAAEFFHCFSSKSTMLSPTDFTASQRGLRECKKQMEAYEECVRSKGRRK